MNARFVAISSTLLLLGSLFCFHQKTPVHPPGTPRASRPAPLVVAAAPEPAARFTAFDAWLKRRPDSSEKPFTDWMAEGEQLAEQRREAMLRLMEHNPSEALRHAISFAEYSRLPQHVRALVEEPFSMVGNWNAFPACGSNAEAACTLSLHRNGLLEREWKVTAWGRLRGRQTKHNTPLQGIRLEGFAAVEDRIFLPLAPADAEDAALHFPQGQAAPQTSLLTGAPLPAQSVTALAGGRLFHFATVAEVAAAEQYLADLDRLPGPHAGAGILLQASGGGNAVGGGAFWDNLAREGRLLASSWTETPKTMLVILVDFPNLPGAPVDKNLLLSNINAEVHSMVQTMSYGKTGITATGAAPLVRMPSPTASYQPSNNSLLHSDAVAAAQAAGVVTDGYDILCVVFGNIGMQGGGVTYAGLAGGSQMWLQNNSDPDVIAHELGHNYGLGHASYWQPGGADPVGAGSSVEYGDLFDVMGSGPVPQGHFHAQGKRLLNWLAPQDITTATASGTFRIRRIDHESTTGVRGLTIPKGVDEAYWICYRRSISGNASLQRGACVLWERPGENRTWLVDMTPGSPGGAADSALLLGKTYVDAAASIFITPVAQGGSGADEYLDVVVNRGPFPGNAAPTATLDGPAAPAPRTTVLYSANAADTNGDALSYFWDFGDGSIFPDAPTVAKTFLVGGSYAATVTVSDRKGGAVQKTLSITVADPAQQWATRTSGTSANFYGIAAGGGKLVTVGDTRGTILTSPDGVTWTAVPESPPNSRLNVYFFSATWTGTQFIAAGMDYDFTIPGWVGTIWTSPDGTTWTLRHKGGEELRAVASNGTRNIAVGDAGTIRQSTDGITWTPVVTSGLTQSLRGVAWGGGVFVAVGFGSTNGDAVVLRSTDGLVWTDAAAGAGLETWQDLRSVAWLNQRFVASGWYSKVRTSTDAGLTWTATGQTAAHETPALAYGNGVWLAAGVNHSNSNADADLFSTDGTSWTTASPGAIPDRNAAVFFNHTFITVGTAGSIRQSGVVSAPSGWSYWSKEYFPSGGPSAAPSQDADGDGYANATEYAAGTNPLQALSRPQVSASTEGGALTLALIRSARIPDVSYLVETSPDLGAGSWSAAGTTSVTDSPTLLKVRLTSPIASSPRGFLRFRALIWE